MVLAIQSVNHASASAAEIVDQLSYILVFKPQQQLSKSTILYFSDRGLRYLKKVIAKLPKP